MVMMRRMMIMRMMMKMVRLTMMLTMARMMVMKMMMKMVRLTFMSLPLAVMPKTLVFTALFCSLYNMLHKDVEQDTLSQAS